MAATLQQLQWGNKHESDSLSTSQQISQIIKTTLSEVIAPEISLISVNAVYVGL